MKFIHKLFTLSLSTSILIGLILGLATGVMFGESCAWLNLIGTGFVRLLQMTILPYIVVSLVLGIGSLTLKDAKMLAVKGGILLCVFWGIALGTILIMPLTFPSTKSGAFFSTSSIMPAQDINYLEMYIPNNPFNSMANSVIPAVVLFCLFVGGAMIGMPQEKKQGFLHILTIMSDALTKVTHLVVRLTPVGVYAISAAAAGTMTIAEVGRLQVYFAVFIASAVLLSFFIFPMLTTMLTPFKYRDVVNLSKDALITAFTTGNLFVILPVVTENSKKLFEKYDLHNDESESLMDVIIPVYFNFPDSGKLLSLLFLLFAAWFIGAPLPLSKYPIFAFSGFFSFFGGVDMALPYLLNTFQIPSNMFQLYIIAGIVNGRFGTLLAAMDLIAFTLICTGAIMGLVKFRWHRVIIYSSAMLALFIGTVVGLHIVLQSTYKNDYAKNDILEKMEIKDKVKNCKVYKKVQSTSVLKETLATLPTLGRIVKRGSIRIGYNPDSLPFCYFNGKNELVGYDMAMAHHLASELQCGIEFIPVKYDDVDKQLASGNIDIVMAGLSISVQNLKKMDFSDPYMTLTMGFLVKSYRKQEFESQKKIQEMDNLKIATVWNSSIVPMIKKYLPNAEIVLVKTNEEFFSDKCDADALLISAQAGCAWTLKYPQYTVVLPQPLLYKTDAAYGVAKNNLELLTFLNQWIRLAKLNNLMRKEYNYWILGQNTQPKKPRWCIMKDVFGIGKKADTADGK